MTNVHRWLGTPEKNRAIGRAITGACNLAFLFLVISGFYLWWPRKWTKSAGRAIVIPELRLRGKARDFNWHNAIGFWCCADPFLHRAQRRPHVVPVGDKSSLSPNGK